MDLIRKLEPAALLLMMLVALNWAIDAIFGTNVINEVIGSGTARDVVYVAAGVGALMLLPRLLGELHLGKNGTRPHGA
jgi:uncharacterized membrane protein YuzA (DUF378 family)